MSLYGEVARRTFRRHAAYRGATAAGIFTNTVFGFIKAYVLIELFAAQPMIGGYDVSDAITYSFITQGLIATVAIWGWMQALHPEFREEAGADLLDFEVVGRLHFWSGAERPYRPHLPHPEFHQVVGYGEVEIVGDPAELPDGEHVRSVEFVPLPEAVARIRDQDPWDGELLQLVAEIRSTR